jgi:hypothetical protein
VSWRRPRKLFGVTSIFWLNRSIEPLIQGKRAKLSKKNIRPVSIPARGEGSMNSKKNTQQDLTKELEELNVKDVDSFTKFFSGEIDQLISKAKMCPKMEEEGRSECPIAIAEELYLKKEEMEEKVANGLTKLRRYMGLVDKEINRFNQNLNQTRADANALHFKQAKEKYADAIHACEFHLEKNKKRRNTLIDLNSRAEEALNIARSKKWPFGKPKEKYRPTSVMPGELTSTTTKGFQGSAFAESTTALPPIEKSIDSLMSLGPIHRKSDK